MGIEEAILTEVKEKGAEEAKMKKTIEVVEEMLKDNLSFEQIAKYVKVSVEFVKEVAREVSQ
jgi:predicted transposase YdaD